MTPSVAVVDPAVERAGGVESERNTLIHAHAYAHVALTVDAEGKDRHAAACNRGA